MIRRIHATFTLRFFPSSPQTKARLRESEKRRKNIEWEHEVLQQRFQTVESERNDLYDQFESEITNVQQRNELKTMVLERKIKSMEEAIETKEAQITEVLKASNIDPGAMETITEKLGDIVQQVGLAQQASNKASHSLYTRNLTDTCVPSLPLLQKNSLIRSLQHDIAKVSKAHNDLIRVYESKLSEYGIPIQELGFRPLVTKATTTTAAAGLVAAAI